MRCYFFYSHNLKGGETGRQMQAYTMFIHGFLFWFDINLQLALG